MNSKNHKQEMEEVKEKVDNSIKNAKKSKGLILVLTGDGKGKSSSAFGMGLRFLGHGKRIGVVQFIKGQWKTGEKMFFEKHPDVSYFAMGDGFTWETQDKEEDIARAKNCFEKAKEFIHELGAPIVIKADGLAAGKGVIIAETIEEAEKATQEMLSGDSFGHAGAEIVIEEFMDGEEMSFFALSDGENFVPLTSAQDHKRVFDGDKGPNTGGMGAYSPAHFASTELEKKIIDRIIRPTVEGMKKDGIPFAGVLYAGLMIVNGEPKLIEYNARFGDPETQPLLMRLENDLVDVLMASATGNMKDFEGKISFSDDVTLCVVMAANGYPASYEKGTEIKVEALKSDEQVCLFHAGTLRDNSGTLINTGGRVLNIVGRGTTTEEAQRIAYEATAKIDWPEGFYRSDIGWRAIKAQKKVA